MASTSHSCSPPNEDRPPLFLVRLAADAQRDIIYRERTPAFQGRLSDEAYFRKTRTRTKSVWALVTADNLHSDHRASVEVFLRDIYWREKPDSEVVVRKAAYLSALFVPIRWRGHGYARELLHRVMSSLRDGVEPPFTDIALVYVSVQPGLEGMYPGAQWQTIGSATWSPDIPPRFDLFGALPTTKPIYETQDISGLIVIAADRAKSMVVKSDSNTSCFAIKPDEDSIRLRAANYRENWECHPADIDQPLIFGARIGTTADPSLSFALWGYQVGTNSAYRLSVLRLTHTGLLVWTISSVNDLHTLALLSAATQAARQLKCERVIYLSTAPGRLAEILTFKFESSPLCMPTGTILTSQEGPNLSQWLGLGMLDWAPSSGA